MKRLMVGALTGIALLALGLPAFAAYTGSERVELTLTRDRTDSNACIVKYALNGGEADSSRYFIQYSGYADQRRQLLTTDSSGSTSGTETIDRNYWRDRSGAPTGFPSLQYADSLPAESWQFVGTARFTIKDRCTDGSSLSFSMTATPQRDLPTRCLVNWSLRGLPNTDYQVVLGPGVFDVYTDQTDSRGALKGGAVVDVSDWRMLERSNFPHVRDISTNVVIRAGEFALRDRCY